MRSLHTTLALAGLLLAMVIVPAQAVAPVPPNDALANATVITALPFHETFDISGATIGADDELDTCTDNLGSEIRYSVWYTFTATAAASLVVDLLDSDFDGGSTIFRGDPATSPNATCVVGQSNHRVALSAGQKVWIRVYDPQYDGGGGDGSTIDVRIFADQVPAHDSIADARTITGLPYVDDVDDLLATEEPEDEQLANACGFAVQRSVWYRFTATADTRRVRFQIGGHGADVHNVIVATGSPGNLTPVTCPRSRVTDLDLDPGTTYYVLVSVDNADDDRFELQVSIPPPAPTAEVWFRKKSEVFQYAVFLRVGYRCTAATPGIIYGTVTQGRDEEQRTASLQYPLREGEQIICDGRKRLVGFWAVEENGLSFEPGRATLDLFITGSDSTGFGFIQVQAKSDKLWLFPYEPAA